MQEIKLDDCYLDDVLEGLKISTIRQGHRKYTLGEAKLVTTSKSVDIIITKVTHLLYKNLTLYDAVNDGFSSLEELKNTLIFYYPNLYDNDEVTIVYYDIEI